MVLKKINLKMVITAALLNSAAFCADGGNQADIPSTIHRLAPATAALFHHMKPAEVDFFTSVKEKISTRIAADGANFKSDVSRLWEICNQIYRQEHIEKNMPLLINYVFDQTLGVMLGEGYYNFLQNTTNTAFNSDVLARSLTHFQGFLADGIVRMIGRTTLVARGPHGEQWPVYDNKSIFRRVAEASGITHIPFGGALLGILDHNLIKGPLQICFNKMTLKILNELFMKFRDKTIAQVFGEQVLVAATDGRRYVTDELRANAVDFYNFVTGPAEDAFITEGQVIGAEEINPLWDYLKTPLEHYTRQFMTNLFTTTENAVINALVIVGQKKSASWIGGAGATLFSFGASIASLGYPGWTAASAVLGGAGVYLTGPYFAHQTISATGETVKERMRPLNEFVGYTVFPYGETEHHRYGMNPNPSAFERELFATDYDQAIAQQNKTLVGEVIKELVRRSQDQQAVRALFGLAEGAVNVTYSAAGQLSRLIEYFTQENDANVHETYEEMGLDNQEMILTPQQLQERAFRRWVWLKNKKDKTEAEKQVLANIQKYPSFDIRYQQIMDLNERIRIILASQKSQDVYIKRRDEIVKIAKKHEDEIKPAIVNLEKSALDLAMIVCKDSDFTNKEFFDAYYLAQIFIDHMLNLHTKDQDCLVQAYADEEFWASFAKELKIEVFDDDKSICANKMNALLKSILAAYTKHQNEKTQIAVNQQELNKLRENLSFISLSDHVLQNLLSEKREILEQHNLLGEKNNPLLEDYAQDRVTGILKSAIDAQVRLQYVEKTLENFGPQLEKSLKKLMKKVPLSGTSADMKLYVMNTYRDAKQEKMLDVVSKIIENQAFEDGDFGEFEVLPAYDNQQMNNFYMGMIWDDLYENPAFKNIFNNISGLEFGRFRQNVYELIRGGIYDMAEALGKGQKIQHPGAVASPDKFDVLYLVTDDNEVIDLVQNRIVWEFNNFLTSTGKPGEYAALMNNNQSFDAFYTFFTEKYLNVKQQNENTQILNALGL